MHATPIADRMIGSKVNDGCASAVTRCRLTSSSAWVSRRTQRFWISCAPLGCQGCKWRGRASVGVEWSENRQFDPKRVLSGMGGRMTGPVVIHGMLFKHPSKSKLYPVYKRSGLEREVFIKKNNKVNFNVILTLSCAHCRNIPIHSSIFLLINGLRYGRTSSRRRAYPHRTGGRHRCRQGEERPGELGDHHGHPAQFARWRFADRVPDRRIDPAARVADGG